MRPFGNVGSSPQMSLDIGPPLCLNTTVFHPLLLIHQDSFLPPPPKTPVIHLPKLTSTLFIHLAMMPLQPTNVVPSASESQCPDCGKTMSRPSDLKRHRKAQHPDGTEPKIQCPWPGCQYQTNQGSNLKTHCDARHSNELRYPCLECGRRFSDGAARIRHRKNKHGYQPYHTSKYLARQELKKTDATQKTGKVVSSKTAGLRTVPYSFPNASTSNFSLGDELTNVPYHNDFWKQIVDMAVRRRDADSQHPLTAQVHGLEEGTPDPDAPSNFQAVPDVSTQAVSPLQPFTPPSDVIHGSIFPNESQALGQLSTRYSSTIPCVQSDYVPSDYVPSNCVPSDYVPLFPSFDTDPVACPISGSPLSYPVIGYQSQHEGPAMVSYNNVPIPDAVMVPTVSTVPPSSLPSSLPFFPPNYEVSTPPEPVSELNWSSSPSSTISMPYPQFFFPSPRPGHVYDDWSQSNLF
ncbi:hypothetical protein B0F90DRAFT_265747 [Multifurca ochricompacta]|uniref:C2H2-type domain-containing protein n=1 Tax=Multifurca ochricompacta TaxID=376703 RepID=A0AAD4M4Z9_9AGAM|nr:hypothetical protein B0F90DRAFT_265747 [Multifurca ochricompacta]